MNALLVVGIGLLGLAWGFLVYSRKAAQWFGVDPSSPTPAHRLYDGLDYVPTPTPILFGHHFASIAGAGPIIGPILAASYGWLGVFLWLILGAIFAGGLHDMGSIIASVKHNGRTIGELIKCYIRPEARVVFLLFAWITLVLVIAAFDVIVAKTFAKSPPVATASMLFLVLAVIFGLLRKKGLGIGLLTLLGLLGLGIAIWLGFRFPLALPQRTWQLLLFAYVFLAAVTPVWILLQPRDYLNAFLLYGLLGGGLLGLIFHAPQIRLPAFTGFSNQLGPLFPLLFVITSCGAVSGFHSLVGSGTTARQLDRESQARVVGYGGMLLETILALVALMSVAIFPLGQYHSLLKTKGPIAAFAQGVGGFFSSLGLPFKIGVTFAALAVSGFALTSLDTATRVGRFTLEEIIGLHTHPWRRFLTTGLTVALAAILALTGTWKSIWPLMGTANQLLAALALLALMAWLRSAAKHYRFLQWPALFMLVVTISALAFLIAKHWQAKHFVLVILAFGLLILALYISWMSFRPRGGLPKGSCATGVESGPEDRP